MQKIRNYTKSFGLWMLTIIIVFAQHIRAGEAVDMFVHCEAVDSNSVAVVVVDLVTGKTTESYNADKALLPASVMKTITIGSLISKTGIDFHYLTKLFIVGKLDNGVLHGNLLVEGSGDPSLNSTADKLGLDFVAECIEAIQKKGIMKIDGKVLIDGSIFPAPATHPTWASADLKYGYGAGCFGFNFRNNSYVSGGQSYSVANPSNTFVAELVKKLKEQGIEFGNEVIDDVKTKKLICEHKSASIDDIMRSCMMRSDNLYAETFLRTYAMLNGRKATTDEGASLETSLWKSKGLNLANVKIIDGSGLSRSNRMTARFLADMLKKMSKNVDYVSFFPLAGKEGTLKSFLKDTELDSYIALKTGSMRGVQCYAGYKLDEDYAPTHVVVIMINNFTNRSAVKKGCEQMLLEIFK